MGRKNKLKRFKENETFPNVFQPTREELVDDTFGLKGQWRDKVFKNDNPLVLELGCGKGEYTVGLAERYPNKNFVGVDIKGARFWRGAKTAIEHEISNAAFIRTQIELIEHVFEQNEVDEIWITFPDPQLKRRRARKRLTHPDFLKRYFNILKKNGLIHLKTDSHFLYAFTLIVLAGEHHHLEYSTIDLYSQEQKIQDTDIKTYYEKRYLSKGLKITYVCFRLNY